MGTGITGEPLFALEGETKALATTAGYIAVKPHWHEVKMYCESQWRLALSPALMHAIYYDASAGTYADYTTIATDRLSTTHVPLDAMDNAPADYLYLGFSNPVLGVYVDIGTNANANTATLDVEYCSTAVPGTIAFTNVASDSDGTDSGGATLAVDGVYTWTLPGSSWVRSTLGTSSAPLYSKCYWIRFTPSADLSATVDLNNIIPVYQNTTYGYMEPGVEYQFSLRETLCGGFVVTATAGTPTLNITWVKH